MARRPPITDTELRRLLALRTNLRRFLRWSEEQATRAGVTPAQHQLMLAVRGHPGPEPPSIGDIAAHLLVRHHSAVGLIDRAERAGLVVRHRDGDDHRQVKVTLTARGAEILDSLSAEHLEELYRLGLLAPDVDGLDREPEAERGPDA